jgi:hypothetical protein
MVYHIQNFSHREDMYDMTDSSWVSLRFRSQVFRFYSTGDASGRCYMSPQMVLHFFALVLIQLVLLARFVAQNSTSFSILVPRICVLYHYFIAYFLVISRRFSLFSGDYIL